MAVAVATAAAATAATMDALRRRLAAVTGEPRAAPPGLPTGLGALDRALPGGGLPRGRLTELVGPLSGGRTTLVRAAVATTLRRGGWVAYVDATRTLAPREWADVATAAATHALCADRPPRLCVVRPHDAARGAWCADVLLRSGAFALVVLDGAPALAHATAVRLTRLARDADAALVVVGEEENGGAARTVGAVRLRVRRGGERGTGRRRAAPARRRLQVTVEKGGSHRAVEVSCGVGLARRLCAHPEVPDRRGVAAGGGRAGGGGGGGGGRAAGAGAGAGDGSVERRASSVAGDGSLRGAAVG